MALPKKGNYYALCLKLYMANTVSHYVDHLGPIVPVCLIWGYATASQYKKNLGTLVLEPDRVYFLNWPMHMLAASNSQNGWTC